jgi:hypothetical protein
MEPEDLFLCSQDPATDTYPEAYALYNHKDKGKKFSLCF